MVGLLGIFNRIYRSWRESSGIAHALLNRSIRFKVDSFKTPSFRLVSMSISMEQYNQTLYRKIRCP